MIDRRLSRATRPFRRLARAGVHRADSILVRRVATAIVGSAGRWDVGATRRARSGTRIVVLEDDDGNAAFLKLADSPGGSAQLAREKAMLTALTSRVAGTDLGDLLPETIDAGQHENWFYVVQRAVPGEPATRLLADATTRRWLVEEAARLAVRLRDATADEHHVTRANLDEWVERPIELIASLTTPDAKLRALRTELLDALTGASLRLGFIHGDYWSENLLVDPRQRRVTGIVDWDSADAANLIAHDLLHLLLYTRKLLRTTEIGTEICRALSTDARWDEGELAALRQVPRLIERGTSADNPRTEILLYWLRLVAMNHARQPKVTSRSRWIADNIDAVLSCA
jgi:Ser/Thr protein kinase RdoA (MazF antagonist)